MKQKAVINQEKIENSHLKLNVDIQVTAVDIVEFVSVHLPTEKH